jgi:hypothetical protein
MDEMFKECRNFNNGSVDDNGDPSSEDQNPLIWNPANVTTMKEMFNNCSIFNSEMKSEWTRDNNDNLIITTWDVSKVTNMRSMFRICRAFNQESVRTWNMKPLFDYSPSSTSNMFQFTAFLDSASGVWIDKTNGTPTYALYESYKGNQDKNYLENPHYNPNYNQ